MHHDYFTQAAKYQKAKCELVPDQKKLTALQVEIAEMEKKKRTEELKQLEMDTEIKGLQRRKLQLDIAQQEAVLHMYVLRLQSSINHGQQQASTQ